jgi:hypothetical protein
MIGMAITPMHNKAVKIIKGSNSHIAIKGTSTVFRAPNPSIVNKFPEIRKPSFSRKVRCSQSIKGCKPCHNASPQIATDKRKGRMVSISIR